MKTYLYVLLFAVLTSTTVYPAPIFPDGMNETAAEKTVIQPNEQPRNKRIVLDFYEKALNQKDTEAALKYLGSNYKQHNPTAADGPAGFRNFIAFLKEKFPQSHSEITQVFVDGNYVILHVHTVRVPGTRGDAIIDIFRVEQGKIVEHWDVTQAIPEQTASGNSMF